MDKELMQKFRDKFEENPQRFKSLPGASLKWPADKLVLIRALSQAAKPQSEIAKMLSLDRTTVCKKINSVNWTEFEASLKEALTEGDKDFAERELSSCVEGLYRRAEKRQEDAMIRLDAVEQVVERMIVKHVAPLPKAWVPSYKFRSSRQKVSTPEHVVVLLSDLHVGYEFERAMVGGVNEYNLAVFDQRYKILKKKVIDIFLLHNKIYDMPELHIMGLGDFVHGTMLGGKWSPAFMQTDVYKQMTTACNSIVDMILEWLQYFKKVHFYGVIGNHGRAGKERNSDNPRANWDNACYFALQQRFHGHDRVSVQMTDCWWQLVPVNGTQVLLLHGEQVTGKLHKLILEEQSLQSILPQDIRYDVLCTGHVHNHAERETSRGRVIVNGSFVGADVHGLQDLKVYSRPTQTIFGVHPEHKVTWKYCLDLDRQ